MQVLPFLHLPQSSVPPQPSEMVPQLAPRLAHVVGVHELPAPHTLATPPAPQLWPAGHAPPQSSVPPQPSGRLPQSLPSAAQVTGAHACVGTTAR